MDKIFAITMLKHQFRNINLVSVGPHNAIYLHMTCKKTHLDLSHTMRVLRVQKFIS